MYEKWLRVLDDCVGSEVSYQMGRVCREGTQFLFPTKGAVMRKAFWVQVISRNVGDMKQNVSY